MRRLLPDPKDKIDPYDEYRIDGPWLRVGMVLSLDGSVTDEHGWSDGLGGKADLRIFRTLRALADGIMIGAATVRTGRIGPAKLTAALRAKRGGDPAPIIVVSRSLDLDWDAPLFQDESTIVVTSDFARPPAHAKVVMAGDGDLDLAYAVETLHKDHGLYHLLCEGGPVLATSLLRANLVDELCLNLAPTLLGSPHHTRLLGDLPRQDLTLTAAYTDEDVLFLRYRPAPRP
ncbi:dihydrofolate reductase family protein [Actinocorallia longicatena]|uniref:Pyrimidine reductase family protein n=1 Tax=Actinocorallia longicatena TaxID=111803 RepID=A0ABP6QB59_9ACTN